jgi:hypothetical protein
MSPKRAYLPRIALAIAFATMFGASAVAATPANFTTKDGTVSFWAPRPPKANAPNLVPGEGDKQDRNTTYEVHAANYLMQVTVVELNGKPTTGDEKSLLEPMVQAMGPRFRVDKEGGDIELRLGKLPGRQIRGLSGPAKIALRTFVGVCRVYRFQVTYQPQDKALEQVAEKFFDSVTIKDSPAQTCTLAPAE